MKRIPSFDEQPSSWAYVNYKTLHSGIVLYDGKASKSGENKLEISTNLLKDSQFGLELPEHSEKLSYKVIFSGNIVNSDLESEKIIYFVNSILLPEITQNIEFLDFEETKSEFSNEKSSNINR